MRRQTLFTGIVEEIGTVKSVRPGGLTFTASRVMDDLPQGGSININGVCFTVTSVSDGAFSVDVVPETLRRTNLGSLRPGDKVNLERPVAVAGRLDGHMVQGHVDGTGTVSSVAGDGEALLITVETGPDILRYIVEKGFVAVDGTSLTVVNCDSQVFSFTLIPYTQAKTVLGSRIAGDAVNLEVDIVAKYVEKLQQKG